MNAATLQFWAGVFQAVCPMPAQRTKAVERMKTITYEPDEEGFVRDPEEQKVTEYVPTPLAERIGPCIEFADAAAAEYAKRASQSMFNPTTGVFDDPPKPSLEQPDATHIKRLWAKHAEKPELAARDAKKWTPPAFNMQGMKPVGGAIRYVLDKLEGGEVERAREELAELVAVDAQHRAASTAHEGDTCTHEIRWRQIEELMRLKQTLPLEGSLIDQLTQILDMLPELKRVRWLENRIAQVKDEHRVAHLRCMLGEGHTTLSGAALADEARLELDALLLELVKQTDACEEWRKRAGMPGQYSPEPPPRRKI